jgi:acyl dehydratase
MRVFTSFDEVRAAAGGEVGVSDWLEVTQERIDRFAEATGDFQWIHVDVERARREMPGGKTIAHGYLTLSLVPLLLKGVLRHDGLRNSLNYGSNRVRFTAPVPAGSRIRGRVRLEDAADAPPGGLRVTYRTTVEIDGADRPACIAETMAVHYR